MKKFIYSLSGALVFACIYSVSAFAQDTLCIAGADMSYRWISGNNYEVKLNIYTQCPSADPDSLWIKVKSPDAGFQQMSKLVAAKNMGELRQDCHPHHSHKSTCDGPGFVPGYKHWQATAEFTLYPYNQCEYIFSWDSCCRLKTITTGGASKHFYTEAYMRICEDIKQRSPEFVPQQFFQVQINNCNSKDFRISDAVNNEYTHTYKLVEPRISEDQPLTYSNSYNYKEPFVYDGAFGNPQLDISDGKCKGFGIEQNGFLRFKPTQEDVSPVAVEVSRQRNGKLESRIIKDITYEVRTYGVNNAPIITGINGTAQYKMVYNSRLTKCFTIFTFDPDGDSVTMYATNTPPVSKLDIESNQKFPKGAFCWTPADSQAREEPYFLTIRAVDDKIECGDLGEKQGAGERSIKLFVCPFGDSKCIDTIGVSINVNQSIFGKLNIWPQPAQNYFYAEAEGKKLHRIEMTNMLGQQFTPGFYPEGNKTKVDVSGLPKGVYMLKAFSGERIYGAKVLVQ